MLVTIDRYFLSGGLVLYDRAGQMTADYSAQLSPAVSQSLNGAAVPELDHQSMDKKMCSKEWWGSQQLDSHDQTLINNSVNR